MSDSAGIDDRYEGCDRSDHGRHGTDHIQHHSPTLLRRGDSRLPNSPVVAGHRAAVAGTASNSPTRCFAVHENEMGTLPKRSSAQVCISQRTCHVPKRLAGAGSLLSGQGSGHMPGGCDGRMGNTPGTVNTEQAAQTLTAAPKICRQEGDLAIDKC